MNIGLPLLTAAKTRAETQQASWMGADDVKNRRPNWPGKANQSKNGLVQQNITSWLTIIISRLRKAEAPSPWPCDHRDRLRRQGWNLVAVADLNSFDEFGSRQATTWGSSMKLKAERNSGQRASHQALPLVWAGKTIIIIPFVIGKNLLSDETSQYATERCARSVPIDKRLVDRQLRW
jgi:hypothetical protein